MFVNTKDLTLFFFLSTFFLEVSFCRQKLISQDPTTPLQAVFQL